MENAVITWKPEVTGGIQALSQALQRFGAILPDPLADRIDIEAYAKKLWEHGEVAFAWAGEELIGLLAMYANDQINKISFISIIAVDPRYQSRGIGGELLRESIELAKKKAMTRVWLKVHRTNEKAALFYKRNGFELDGYDDEKIKYIHHLV